MNKNIIENLNYYITSNIKFEYAILLKGSWGSGKTFFIKNYIKDFSKPSNSLIMENHKNSVIDEDSIFSTKALAPSQTVDMLYVSLNGLESLDNIYDLIIESRYQKRDKKIIFSALKAINSISEIINSEKIDINLNDLIKLDKNVVLIFDDIERVSEKIEINDLLGFIFREFIDKIGIKVILLSNENEISKNNNLNYRKIKEKLIGKTFKVESNTKDAVDSFIFPLNSKKILEKYKKIIIGIHITSGYNNLRILKQSIYDFDRIYLNISDNIKTKDKVIKKFLIEFLIKSIEHKKENPAIDRDSIYSFVIDNEFENEEILLNNKYRILNQLELNDFQIIYNIDWKRLLNDGHFSQKYIYLNLDIKIEPLWKRLYNNSTKSDEEFEKDIDFTIESLKKYNGDNIKGVGELKHIIAILLWAFNNNLTVITSKFNTIREIINLGKTYLEYIFNSNTEININDNFFHDFYSKDLKELKIFFEYIKFRYKEKQSENLIIKTKDIFNNLDKNNISEFEFLLEELSNIPILKDFHVEQFIEKTFTPSIRKNMLTIIKRRYQQSTDILALFDEYEFFEKFFTILKERLENLKGRLSYNIISKFISNFDEILESFVYIEIVKSDLEFGETIESISKGYNVEYIKKIKEKFNL